MSIFLDRLADDEEDFSEEKLQKSLDEMFGVDYMENKDIDILQEPFEEIDTDLG